MFLKRLVNALDGAGLQYALVGGYAVALHGAVRGTVDVDIVIGLEVQEFQKIERILMQLGLQSRIPVRVEELASFREEYIRNRSLIAWSFVNPQNPIDLVDVIITHDVRDFKVETKKTVFGTLKVASIADLIAMKKEAGRPQDLLDIEALEKIQGGMI